MSEQYDCDVCLFLEGTYPYISGGVSTWTHNLIREHKDLTFACVCLLPPKGKTEFKFTIPDNVVEIKNVYLQDMLTEIEALNRRTRKKFFEQLEVPLLTIQHKPHLEDLRKILSLHNSFPKKVGKNLLLNSHEAWHMIVRMYLSTIGESSFLNYFWSARCLLGGFFSVMEAFYPKARVYHSLSTGFAGLFLSRAVMETGRPGLTTEHGIYTNERRIEIASADWLEEYRSMDLTTEVTIFDRDLKDFWKDTFGGYSRLCYEASTYIITLFEENKEFQLEDGAAPEKLRIVPNGIDVKKFGAVERKEHAQPTVALIGRVVPIKDIKTFIRAVAHLEPRVANLRVWIMGPTDEDPEYFEDCQDIVQSAGLQSVIEFTGKVDILEYLPEVDIIALSSISESQPLVILEAGCSGIPSVATDVGSCSELIYGRKDENPSLGEGGVICPLANPRDFAEGMYKLLTDKEFYNRCSKTIKERVNAYYRQEEQKAAYDKIYKELMSIEKEVDLPVLQEQGV